MDKKPTILFLPSNRNHVDIFYPIHNLLKEHFSIFFLTQGKFKNEGADDALKNLNVSFQIFNTNLHPVDFLKNNKIDVIIVGNDSDVIPQWFVNCAKKLGIPTVLIQDGLMMNLILPKISKLRNYLKHKKFEKLLLLRLKLGLKKDFKNILYGQSNCTLILTWSKTSESYFENLGISKESMRQIGYPKFITRSKKPTLKKTILYTPTALHRLGLMTRSENTNIVNILDKTISKIPNSKLIIKPHPIEDVSLYKDVVKSSINTEITNNSFSTLIQQVDVVISDMSTTILESLVRGVPVIIFFPNLYKKIKSIQFPFDLIEKNIVSFANNEDELKKFLDKQLVDSIKNNAEDPNFLEHYLGKQDNLFSERAAKHISNLFKIS